MIELSNLSFAGQVFFYTFVFILGLFIGSFLNVVALRLLKEESVVFPGSHCPKCKHPIRYYDNIPVISYIILGGKCRDCKEKIHIQYPIVEFSTALLFLFCFMFFGFSIKTLAMMFVVSLLIVQTVTDLHEQLIFDVTSLGLIPFALIYNFFNLGNVNMNDLVIPMGFPFEVPHFVVNGSLHLPGIFASGIMAIILSFVFFEGLSLLSEKFFGEGKYGFGGGDTKLCMGLGAWFGWEALLAIIFMSFVVQGIVGIPLLMYNWYKEKDWLSFVSIIAVLIAAIGSIVISKFATLDATLTMILILVCFVVVIGFMIVILFQVKKRESFTYLPLGPAIAAAALVIVFYGNSILKVIIPPMHAIMPFLH